MSVTAASVPANHPSRVLGQADLDALKAIRFMTETHLRSALKLAEAQEALISSSDPTEFIDSEWITSFGFLAEDLWENGIDVATDHFRIRQGANLAPRQFIWNLAIQGIEDSKKSYLDLLKALIQRSAYPLNGEPVYGEFRNGSAVQYGDVRGLLSKLGGGSTDPSVELVGGITTGNTMKEFLGQTGINTDEKIWLYGWEDAPRRTFNGHLQMDGLVFEKWDDNGLIISPQDRWLRRNYYAPGDHWGCSCIVSPYFPNFGEPFKI